MIDFDRQYHILALALRLGKASDFKAVGDEGKENYQFLFSKFISMIEQDKGSFFIEPQKKAAIITSLQHTIDFYDTKEASELQNIIENLKENDPTSFVIIPSYITITSVNNHVYSLIIYKRSDHYVLVKTDKLHSDFMNNYYIKFPPERIEEVSELLFATKFDYHPTSRVNIISYIKRKLDQPVNEMRLSMRGYSGVPNCPILEPFTAFRIALYNCHDSIFATHEFYLKRFYKSKECRKRFLNTFLDTNKEQIQKFLALWDHYEKRKEVTSLPFNKEPENARTISRCFLKKVLEDPETPQNFKKKHTEVKTPYKVFTSDSVTLKSLKKHLKTLSKQQKKIRKQKKLKEHLSRGKKLYSTNSQSQEVKNLPSSWRDKSR
ncbi:hypothetical protein A5844_000720 [Enterococcus sp. 10A9_DIV0425]|uniref:Uncharacterized protein n=1 Tax=Candidatus Enterococcus wittei TaxID=1987383 RepID=A0A2C9XS08_9ENTE|nr:hypothetical protein [Enterococcus sp. 10A9_DIV0425]OTP12487.1 hypothetical protein A5844_000720 [Enterococcus sp. 10A9_DIV0425]THE10439.1 hypothetical protein E1H99_09565 [Enterococcus hirae]